MLCKTCDKREYCSDLCPEAELYVKQDNVKQREKNIGLPRFGKLPELKSNTHLTPREREIVTLLGKGLPRKDICQILDIVSHTLRNHIKRIKKKYLK